MQRLGRIRGWAEHMRTGDEVKAKNALAKAEGVRDASDDAKAHTLMVLAQYNILNEEYDAAARHLEDALPLLKKKAARTRVTFVLAQCLREAGDKEGAIEQFEEVADMRWADCEWVFQGNIQQAMTFDRRNGNSKAIVELLEDMLEDNVDYLDQVYYAWAKWLRTVAETSRSTCSSRPRPRTWTTTASSERVIEAGRFVMEDLVTPPHKPITTARWCTLKEDERKEEISSLASDLGSLVDNLNIIEEAAFCRFVTWTKTCACEQWTGCLGTWSLNCSACAMSAMLLRLPPRLLRLLQTFRALGCFGPTMANCGNPESRSSCPTGAVAFWKTIGAA